MSLLMLHCYIPLNLQSIYSTEDRILWKEKKQCIVIYFGISKTFSTEREQIQLVSTLQTETGIQTSMQFA